MADSISVNLTDDDFGSESTPDECGRARNWFQKQLETLYPGVEVNISSEHSYYGPFYHIDNDVAALDEKMIGREKEMTERLVWDIDKIWDNCNWEFLAND